MMVTFVSQCQKNALKKTRRVLDAFADRIGDNTWQAVITEDGLAVVKKMLRQTASKNTAVACHWIRSRSRSELTWIVGNRRQFNTQGIVPVSSTKKDHQHEEWENNWQYLPLIKALAALAALLHDWGKATLLFQTKLKKSSKEGDPLRHEWMSCLLLHALVTHSGDTKNDQAWLNLLSQGKIDEKVLIEAVSKNQGKPLENLPPLAQLTAWLIVTHHRLPATQNKYEYADTEKNEINSLFKSINAEWGYQNKSDASDYKKRLADCFKFPEGLLSQSEAWLSKVKKWSKRLLQEEYTALRLLENGAYRLVLHHARLSLMLGDHYYSSCEASTTWKTDLKLFANTDSKRELKQRLDEHLVNVSQQALCVTQSLSRFRLDMVPAYDIKNLKKKGPPGFEWQDVATDKVTAFRKQNQSIDTKYAWFIVNMASTGCGKTIANAKIMRALSDDGESLRFILALGLRTLTLQTGDEYRDRIGLNKEELAVLIGSSEVKELHEKSNEKKDSTEPLYEEGGSESMGSLLDEDIEFHEPVAANFLDAIFPTDQPKVIDKNKAFLYKPVLVCTIDHIMAATETKRGGKYILPCLRLLSSDLVIDEIDDFDVNDLIAIGRLIHLAGMLGRKVMISSATIPPALAEGYFNAYQEGWRLHQHFLGADAKIACTWIDEFQTQVQFIDQTKSADHCQQYRNLHQQFVKGRVKKLLDQIIKRKAYIVPCLDLYPQEKSKKPGDANSAESVYFERMKQAAMDLHVHHHSIDKLTRKKVSFGIMRVANIPPCIALTQHLMEATWPEQYAPKVMAYHSRQVLLLRHEQEQHLDSVLKRKEKADEIPDGFKNSIIRKHLDQTNADHVLFILIATPVEEVGRDHDFDWAIIEPSSYRSIIQLAGRVRRHRQVGIDHPNIAIMQTNLKALRKKDSPAYFRPGFENAKNLRLKSHDLCTLLDEDVINKKVDATPRIAPAETLRPNERLADLEHQAIGNALTNYTKKGPEHLQAWLSASWWMTAVPQNLIKFRASSPELSMYLVWEDRRPAFCTKNEKGKPIPREKSVGIHRNDEMSNQMAGRFWLNRNYEHSLRAECNLDLRANLTERDHQMMRAKSLRYGEISIPINPDDDRDKGKEFEYSDQFGLREKIDRNL
ncbi:type I-F CRISPR-associated helicase Cas3f [Undibacterium sp. Jales W-56]|uniref:type I-F CRISPR-associated helicase Cas3f n=1 Tax=Undibacterium sp. Jales W-56 TaxID=2897325 RepID=UPI0021D302B4|nr:type I-F CRISPR-associated helicase Cas3f [Undibacterium sp. Jales W-56]MCU6435466.1 type I-F CRISPR-associated helicase Cas3f [Undibacterium sp. Jales W-56]